MYYKTKTWTEAKQSKRPTDTDLAEKPRLFHGDSDSELNYLEFADRQLGAYDRRAITWESRPC